MWGCGDDAFSTWVRHPQIDQTATPRPMGRATMTCMLPIDHPVAHDGIFFARDVDLPGERAAFFAAVRRGEYVAVRRGAYLRAEAWAALTVDERYRALLRATAAAARGSTVFSHHSAAALWRLPRVGTWPGRPHIVVDRATGGRSSPAVVRHAVGVCGGIEIDGLHATTLPRTAVDLARTEPFGRGVVAVDAALRRAIRSVEGAPAGVVTKADLLSELASVPSRQGTAKARKVIAFADGAADRPGESLSRVSMHRARLPMPRLQEPRRGASGTLWTVDFFWPHCNLIGEFDGKLKYLDPAYRGGRTAEQVVYDEKLREDDLRAAGNGFTRWPWRTAISPELLRAHLVAAGLR